MLGRRAQPADRALQRIDGTWRGWNSVLSTAVPDETFMADVLRLAPSGGGATATAYSHALAMNGNPGGGQALLDHRVDQVVPIRAGSVGQLRVLPRPCPAGRQQVGISSRSIPSDHAEERKSTGVARGCSTTPMRSLRGGAASEGQRGVGWTRPSGPISERGGAAEVERAVLTLGPRGKIRSVHFRRRARDRARTFTEVFLGDGKLPIRRPSSVSLLDVGFDGWLPGRSRAVHGRRHALWATGRARTRSAILQGILAALA